MLILKPSLIPSAGVGVFTTADIARGADPGLFPEKDWIAIDDWSFVDRKYIEPFCSRSGSDPDGPYYAPANLHRMCIGWYLNHSAQPNIDAATWRAARDIRAGEELSIDYRVLGGRGAYGE
jgi:hypothetical protein